MPMCSAPIWRMLAENVWDLELRLENFKVWDAEDEKDIDYLLDEWGFWTEHLRNFEDWWLLNPKSRVEVIVYQPPARIGAAVAL